MSVACTLIASDIRHQSVQNVMDTQGTVEWVHNKFWSLWWRRSLRTRVQTRLNHCRFVFLPQYRHQTKWFFSAWLRSEHVDTNSYVYTLIHKGKLANQIATLLSIVLKKKQYNEIPVLPTIKNITTVGRKCQITVCWRSKESEYKRRWFCWIGAFFFELSEILYNPQRIT